MPSTDLPPSSANRSVAALDKQRPNQSLKQTILAQKEFPGVQKSIQLDSYGDVQGRTFMVTIKNGAFVSLPDTP